MPESPLDAAVRQALLAAVGGEHLRTDAESRIRHMRGKSTPDLLRIREGDTTDIPAAVVLPASHDEVLAVLKACVVHDVAVVPFGGGTSVVGGLAPEGGDSSSRSTCAVWTHCSPSTRSPAPPPCNPVCGLRTPKRSWPSTASTLGHFPQSYEWATIGGFAAARSSGQASAGYGRFDEMVLGLTVATPAGTLEAGRAPRSAAGPDLRQLVLGSEGAFGVITAVTVRIRPVPRIRRYEGWRFDSFEAGAAALRRLAQDGPRPTVLASVGRDRDAGRSRPARRHRFRRCGAGRRMPRDRGLRGHRGGHLVRRERRRRS